jgi:hypothetical protein
MIDDGNNPASPINQLLFIQCAQLLFVHTAIHDSFGYTLYHIDLQRIHDGFERNICYAYVFLPKTHTGERYSSSIIVCNGFLLGRVSRASVACVVVDGGFWMSCKKGQHPVLTAPFSCNLVKNLHG